MLISGLLKFGINSFIDSMLYLYKEKSHNMDTSCILTQYIFRQIELFVIKDDVMENKNKSEIDIKKEKKKNLLLFIFIILCFYILRFIRYGYVFNIN